MGVRSTVFGGVSLSGEEAEKFVSQVIHGRPKQAAKDAYIEGRALVKQINDKGYAVIRAERTE